MKHQWRIEPRGKKTKYYICMRCTLWVTATSIKQADALSDHCELCIKCPYLICGVCQWKKIKKKVMKND